MIWQALASALALLVALLVGVLLGRRRPERQSPDERAPDPPTLAEDTDPRSPPPLRLPTEHTRPEDYRETPTPPDPDAGLDADLRWLEQRADALDDDP